jgi:pilus assembly protein CpaE
MTLRSSIQLVVVFSTGHSSVTELLRSLGANVVTAAIADMSSFTAGGHTPPELIVLDVRELNRLPEGTAALKRRYPDASIVLVCSSLEPSLILEAMRAGISECVTEPLTAEGLAAAIERVMGQKSSDATGDLFAFLGAKGGIGTTTIAVNIATALARAKQRTLYVDLHLAYGDAAVFLGAEPRFSIVDALENIHRLDEALFKTLVTTTTAGVDLLASSSQAAVWNVDVKRVGRLLEFVRQHYRYVVVDCPRSDANLLDTLEASTRIVLVANQELATLRSGSRMAAALRQRYRPERVMVVVNRFDSAAEIGHDDVERVIGSTVKHVVPSDYRSSLEALNRGKPLILKNHSRVASSLDALARDLGGLQRPEGPSPKGAGLFGRLTGRR